MPRRKRDVSPTGFYHYMIRGVVKKRIFHNHQDYLKYLELIAEQKQISGVRVHHYCLMTNHAHFLMFAPDKEALSDIGYQTNRRYANYYQKRYGWEGQVFQTPFRSIPIKDESQLLQCGRYIERNPVEAKIAHRPSEYPYSSYLYYASGLRNVILDESRAYQGLSLDPCMRQKIYADFVSGHSPQGEIVDQQMIAV